MKYLVIQKYHDKYPVKKMCEFFNVSRSGYYGFIKEYEKEDKDKWLADMILECQDSCAKTYGYRRVQIWLDRKKGIRVNHKAVLRVMNKYNLLAEIRRKQKYCYSNTDMIIFLIVILKQIDLIKNGLQIYLISIPKKASYIYQ